LNEGTGWSQPSEVSYILFKRDIEQIKFYVGQRQHIKHNMAEYKQSEGDTDGEHIRVEGSKAGKHGENHGLDGTKG